MNEIEKAKSINKLINDSDINTEFLYNWQIDFIRELCEKQIPKKPLNMSTQIDLEHGAKQYTGECPSCENNIVTYAWWKNTHCWICGQKLDWSVEE